MQAGRAARVASGHLARALGACAVVLCAAPAAWAQSECLGFEERTVVDGGTNGLTAVELADLDLDGDQDIVTAAFGDNRLVWYENDPSHAEGFRPHLVSDRMSGAADVHVRDIDADGRPDLVASARSSNTVAWFENAGGSPPLFIARTVDAVARIALGVHAADVNGDGRVDLLSTSYLDGKVFWYEQEAPPEPGDIASNTPPTFTKHEVTDDAPGAAAVFAVDLDGDSDADVLTASRLDDTVAWYRNDLNLDDDDATPDFVGTVITSTFRGATAVIAADLDRDGRADVIAAAPEDDAVAWWPNGGGTFPESPSLLSTTPRAGVRSVKAADLDGDGDLDVLSASDRDDTIAWYENPCATPAPVPCGALAAFVEHFVTTTALHANDAAAAELDASPGVDVVSVSSVAAFPASQDKLAWYRNVAAALPDLPLETRIDRAADGAVAVFAADLDGDLDVDVATAGRTNRITWFENSGAAKAESPAFAEHVIATNALGAADIDGGDLDCDGDVDLVSASADGDEIAWYENDGAADPTFDEQAALATEADEVRDVLVVDLDGDGDLDVLSASPGDGEIAWYENGCLTGGAACVPASSCPAPSFVRRVITEDDPAADPPVETGARSVHAADVDGDGDLDVLAALETASRVRWYEHPADPSVDPWTEHDVLNSAGGGQFVITGVTSTFGADIDGDDDTDVVATSGPARVVLWLESDGNAPPAFTLHVLASDANDASSAYAFDIDSDGDQDILAAVPGDGLIAWFENNGAESPEFAINIVASGVDFAYSSTVANVNGDVTDDDPPVELYDLVAGQRLEVSWFQASGEICQDFDLNGDDRIDGMELAWIGRAFGLADPPPGVWWERADLNRDGIIDGDDLAYLGSSGVFGFTTADCSLICR